MGVKAKGKTFLRILGAVLIFIGLISSSIFRISLFTDIIAYLIGSLIFFPWLAFLILLKLELGFFTSKSKVLFSFLTIYSLIIILINFTLDISSAFLILLEFLINFLLLCCWNFSLSIYKKKKILFLTTGLSYILIYIIYSLKINILNYPIIIVNIVIMILGFMIILIIELYLKRKGLLKYI